MTKEHAEYVADVIAFFKASGVRVRGERVCIVRDPSMEKTSGGLFIPEEGKRKEPRGTVVSIGRTVPVEADIEVGDRVMYTKYSPIHFTIKMPDGRTADVEMFHVSDIYLSWRGDDVA